MDMDNNDAIKYCWEQHQPSYVIAAGCAHEYIAANTKREIERQREYNKKHPLVYYKERIRRY